jgi:tetratricopeptide (TPR) repeat protein
MHAVTPDSPPLVSIVVRSIGRPELATALASAAAQDHSALEILVIDATGGKHPPLPAIDLRPGHSISLVCTGRRLPRPHAANAGLDASRGEYFCFLDDDDAYEPGHVSTLLAAASAHPECHVVYGQTQVRNPDGSVLRVFGQPFNRALMYFGPLFHPQAALIRSKVLALGCRFDEAFEICSDRDFLAQVAEHSGFHYVPKPVFNYRPDLGTSGTGQQANRNIARFIVFESRLRAKWAGPMAVHNQRAGDGNRLAIASYASGDRRAAAVQFAQVLTDYPEDPNALHGLARLALEDGDLETGLDHVRRALAINADAAEFQLTYAQLLVAHGRVDEAVEAARLAMSDPSFAMSARTFLHRYGATDSPPRGSPISRVAPCPCGSGRRFKHCHGSVAGVQVESAFKASHPLVVAASADLRCGELARAIAHVEALRPGDLVHAEDARVAGSICSELGRHDLAIDFLSRSLELRDDRIVRKNLAQTCAEHFRELSDASMEAMRQSTADKAGPPGNGPGDVFP